MIAAAALFLLLTLLKLFLPEQSAAARERVREAVSRDYDYRAAFEELGDALTGASGAGEAKYARGTEMPVLGVYRYRLPTAGELLQKRVNMLPAGTTGDISAAAASQPAANDSAAPAAVPAAEPEVPEVVTAFLASQAQYADEAVPANVSYGMPDLPFTFQSPVTGMTSSGFGFRMHPLQNEVKFHYGTDFAAWTGTDIVSFADGTVAMVGWDDGYGNYIMIDHDGGWRTMYAHCSKVYVTGGDKVTRGQKIGLVGDTGEVTGPHLHFELTCGGTYYNPEFYLA